MVVHSIVGSAPAALKLLGQGCSIDRRGSRNTIDRRITEVALELLGRRDVVVDDAACRVLPHVLVAAPEEQPLPPFVQLGNRTTEVATEVVVALSRSR